MVNITSAQLDAFIAFIIWPMTRLIGLFLIDPFLSAKNIPKKWKIAFILWLSLLIAPVIPPIPNIPLVSAAGFSITVQQLLIGLCMGAFLKILFAAVEISGVIMGMQMGLGFAMFFDLQHAAPIPLPSRLMSTFFFLLFLVFDGHHIMLELLVKSFEQIPIGASITLDHIGFVIEWSAKIFYWGVWLAMPMIGSLLLTNMAMGIMTRAAPQFNIFSFGFPLTLMIGFAIFYFSIPFIATTGESIFRESFVSIQQFLALPLKPQP
jgi:flagellar biosynthetic protein FliR